MNHYEELGIRPSATTDEIRHGYRRLVRLMHPDHCGDDELRSAAELQMRRLNAMLADLTDPERRREYDLSLDCPPVQARFPGAAPAGWRTDRLVWLAAGALALIPLVTLFRGSSRPFKAETQTPAGAQASPKPREGGPAKRAKRARATPPRPHQHPLPARELPDETVVERREQPRTAEEDSPQMAAPALPPDLPPAAAPPSSSRLAGYWFFVASPGRRTDGLYPPEYIELHIRDDAGILRGKYRARYRVTDRSISPGVAFQFEGRAAAEALRVPWMGEGGAAGQVSIRLLTEGCLEINWVADKLSDDLGLISGTATLVRRIE